MSTLAVVVACGARDGAPLGGPYGGTGTSPSPSPIAAGGATGDDSTSTSSGPGSGSGSGGTQEDSGSVASGDGGAATSSGGGGGNAPTWTDLWTSYFAPGTPTACTDAGCHAEMKSAAGSYTWLVQKRYLGGSAPALVDPAQSCLSWYGGGMPKKGPASLPKAVADMNAWAAAGALNN